MYDVEFSNHNNLSSLQQQNQKKKCYWKKNLIICIQFFNSNSFLGKFLSIPFYFILLQFILFYFIFFIVYFVLFYFNLSFIIFHNILNALHPFILINSTLFFPFYFISFRFILFYFILCYFYFILFHFIQIRLSKSISISNIKLKLYQFHLI